MSKWSLKAKYRVFMFINTDQLGRRNESEKKNAFFFQTEFCRNIRTLRLVFFCEWYHFVWDSLSHPSNHFFSFFLTSTLHRTLMSWYLYLYNTNNMQRIFPKFFVLFARQSLIISSWYIIDQRYRANLKCWLSSNRQRFMIDSYSKFCIFFYTKTEVGYF